MSAGRRAGAAASGERAGGGRARGRRAPGRRPGESGTRAAIGEAARAQFADFGYHGATIRGIAAAAQVDPALIHHYYGTKEALFADAMRLPVVPSEMLTAALTSRPEDSGLGAHLVRTALTLWESAGVKDTFLGLLRSAVTSEQASVMLREFITDTILATVARATGLDEQPSAAEAQFRASLVATQMLGLALTRLVLGLPGLTEVTVDELATAVGPSVDRYLTGDIGLPARATRRQRRARGGSD
ncbi:MAG TPA: TetR family transcriptional regulator [Streptosporangiaceae bacterium]